MTYIFIGSFGSWWRLDYRGVKEDTGESAWRVLDQVVAVEVVRHWLLAVLH